jgi:hypothetical protein
MQLVYVLGHGSQWADNEIRYSLRSAQRYYPHSSVLVIGQRPTWLQGVQHLQAMDPYADKVQNVIHKLSMAVHAGVLQEEITLMNDDFLFLAPVQGALPTYVRGTLAHRLAGMDANNGYRRIHELAYDRLRSWGVADPLDYGTHTPMRMRTTLIRETLDRFGGSGSAYPFRSCYGNQHRVPGVLVPDCKLHRTFVVPRGQTLLSLDDEVVRDPAFQVWIARRFAEASRYEVA